MTNQKETIQIVHTDFDVKFKWRMKSEYAIFPIMALRTCLVSCHDLRGVEHTVEVTAESLYEAVALGLRALQENDWVDEIGRGFTAVKVEVKPPEVKHTVLVKDFERWLNSPGGSPAEVALKGRVRSILR